MPYILIQHLVEDYDKWKLVFDEHGATRQAAGSSGGSVLRNADDPNHLLEHPSGGAGPSLGGLRIRVMLRR